MYDCFHTTKLKNLNSILQNGLQPIYGSNSSLTSDKRKGVSYSAGIQATVNTFSVFDRFYYKVVEGWINENNFKEKLSPEEYAKHQESVRKILESKSFLDWIKDNVYLCFDGDTLSDRHEERPEDSYTNECIPPNQLRVCVIRNRRDNSYLSFSMVDVYCFLYAKHPELSEGLCTWEYEEDISKYKSDDYYMTYLSLEQFCELYPKLIANNGLNTKSSQDDTKSTLTTEETER